MHGEMIRGRITKFQGRPAKLGKQLEVVQPAALVLTLEIPNTPELAKWVSSLNTHLPGVLVAMDKAPNRQLDLLDEVMDEAVERINRGEIGDNVTASRSRS